MNVILTKEIIKNQVRTLRIFLLEGGYKITQTSAYQCLAKIYGFENWTALSNELTKKGE